MGFKDRLMKKAMEKAVKSGKLQEMIGKAKKDMVIWEKDIRKKEQDKIIIMIGKMKKGPTIIMRTKESTTKSIPLRYVGYNEAIDDIIVKIKEAK